MRLPRRVPWSSLAELEQLCSAIYTDEHDIDSKIYAINKISAWRAITTLPHALESTLSILVAVVHDRKSICMSALFLRQSYATAILRLVNGLVDPLQVGTYARSITSIAQQLGLPNWLVELRHAATHEDLPSLDLLREGGKQCLAWLLHNYFLPIINPVLNPQQIATPLRPLSPMLKLYKNTIKTITRDVSLASQYKPKLVAILRDLERWISEARVAANISSGELGWSNGYSAEPTKTEEEADVKEIWALERFCDALADKGMLVPLSKKKRNINQEAFLPSKLSISFWTPLLEHVHAIHPDFYSILCRRLTALLLDCNSSPTDEASKRDLSFEEYIACWVNWTVKSPNENSMDMKRDVLTVLVKGLRYEASSLSDKSPIVKLVHQISAGEPDFERMANLLLKPFAQNFHTTWESYDLEVMKERVYALQSSQTTPTDNPSVVATQDNSSPQISLSGWSTLQNNQWKECPIGVFREITV
ncbi:Las1-domain-containing protein [Agrocybe pediades]|nr:Las1-domain-containing protein [Agrocybe pediades]